MIDSELRGANLDMKSVFLSAAAGGCLNEPVLSVQHLDKAYSGLQDCSIHINLKGGGQLRFFFFSEWINDT